MTSGGGRVRRLTENQGGGSVCMSRHDPDRQHETEQQDRYQGFQ